MSSQYGEHEHILRHFAGRVGRFLDIGAFDGVTFSNTRRLAELGWAGVLVEPSPAAFVHLMKNYQGNSKVQLVNAGLAAVSDLRPFWVNTTDGLSADAMSSYDQKHVAKFPKHPFREISISAITWDMLLGQHQGPYQFVNIDVEGMNVEILTGLCDRIAQIQPEMVCVELDPESETQWMIWKLDRAGLPNREIVGGNLLCWK